MISTRPRLLNNNDFARQCRFLVADVDHSLSDLRAVIQVEAADMMGRSRSVIPIPAVSSFVDERFSSSSVGRVEVSSRWLAFADGSDTRSADSEHRAGHFQNQMGKLCPNVGA